MGLAPIELGEVPTCRPQEGPSVVPLERLKPEASCKTPEVEAHCENGFCRIPAGCFVMGAPRDEPGAGAVSDRQVQVTLTRSFRIGRTPVTVGQWKAAGWQLPVHMYRDNRMCFEPGCPVVYASLFDAVEFVNRLSDLAGLPQCYELSGCTGSIGLDLRCEGLRTSYDTAYACPGYRLPTEAEWEYAARAGTITATFAGEISAQPPPTNDCRRETTLDDIAWYCCNSEYELHPVGQKKANPWGLYDVLGNVPEWTSDIRDGLGYQEGPLIDPISVAAQGKDLMPADTDLRAFSVRGGSFSGFPTLLLAANRFSYPVNTDRETFAGLRVVQTLDETD